MISIVLGLGNIGAEYEATRHNLGFEVLDRVAKLQKAVPQKPTREYTWSLIERSPEPLVLAWPRTYMNRSGLAAVALLERVEREPSEMLVVVDDFNLPLGALRFRQNGSDGGHNGLASIIEILETEVSPGCDWGSVRRLNTQVRSISYLASLTRRSLRKHPT